jgi:7-cyano-7-deazaguanine synthase in queuosine biosynthesis
MKTVKLAPGVYFDYYEHTPVGVSVSGGADSALLLHYLLRYNDGPIHVFTLHSDYKLGTNAHHAMQVVAHLSRETGRRDIHHHVSYVAEQTKTNLWDEVNAYLKSGTIQAVYSGVTANPPPRVTATFGMQDSTDPARSPTVARATRDGRLLTPWTNFNKQTIAQLYAQENLMDSLFPLTRSCEWAPVMGEDIPDPHGAHCGQCWWCQERYWGFGKL